MTIDTRTELEELKDMYCDCYKDVHGVKARWVYGRQDLTVEDLKGMLARLEVEYTFVRAEEVAREQKAIETAQKQIGTLLRHGAKDTAMAIRWMHESYRTDGDNRFLDYELGTPFGWVDSLLEECRQSN
jgi:hypothetical protein